MARPCCLWAAVALAAACIDASRDFPFYFDVGGFNTSTITGLASRVAFGKVLECPHPCGLLPSAPRDASGEPTNGGIPQKANLTLHLATINSTFETSVPLNCTMWIDLDWENWVPSWIYVGKASYYQNESIALVRQQHPDWSNSTRIEAEAARQFEAAGLALLIESIRFVRSIRPGLRIGMYGYPRRFYYNGYNSSDGDRWRAENDRMYPLICELDGLFPTVYQFYDSRKSSKIEAANREYVRSNVDEAMRLARGAPSQCAGRRPLVLVYTWHRYHSSAGLDSNLVADVDEQMTWDESYAAGADAVVLWGAESARYGNSTQFFEYYVNDLAPLVNRWSPSTN